MKRTGVTLLLFLMLSRGFSQNTIYDPARLFSIVELTEDITFFKAELEKIHPNPYQYTAKENFNLYFDSLVQTISKPLTEMEFYNIITLMNSRIKDGHTMLLPSRQAAEYYATEGKFFPFSLLVTRQAIYINMNCTADTTLRPGAEIISINGSPAVEIVTRLLQRQIRDGYNETYPLWILNTFFKSYYSFTYGHPETFDITCKSKNILTTKTVAALSNDSIKFYRQLNYPGRIAGTPEKQGITLEFPENTKTAILTIKDFHNSVLKTVYKQNFRKTIEEYFDEIINNKTTSLILDLRNNQGGDIENGKILLSHLVPHTFTIIDAGPSSGAMQPSEKQFEGSLYVLINGGSFSNSGIVSSFLQKNTTAVFLGEETGGNRTIIFGNPKSITLPHTKIQGEISSDRYLLRNNITPDGHGVMPAYYTVPVVEELINNIDKAKEIALELIRKGGSH